MTLARPAGRVYDAVTGRHPHLRPLHFQWLGARDLYADLRAALPTLSGRVLDVGCGDKPYREWLGPGATHVVGVDRSGAGSPDVAADLDEGLPLRTGAFDAAMCIQVVEFLAEPRRLVEELHRCIRPGGTLVLAGPFLFSEHGMAPGTDLRRFSAAGFEALVSPWFDVTEVRREGALGTAVGQLVLNFVALSMGARRGFARAPWAALLVVLTPVVNVVARLVDAVDRTGRFYMNVLVVARRRP